MHGSSMATHFKRIAPQYRELRYLDAHAVQRVSRELQGLSGSTSRLSILDVGAGTGRYTDAVLRDAGVGAGRSYHGVAFDAVSEMLSAGAAHRAVDWGTVDRTIGLAELLPFRAQSFDAVLTFNAVHHFDLVTFFAEAGRVLRPEGRLILYTRTPEQNAHTIWGQFFPHFTERETRLYTESAFGDALREATAFESPEMIEMPWTISTTLPRLIEQARRGGYSTFSLYTPDELEEAIQTFEARVRERFADPMVITAKNDHVMCLAVRS